MIPQLYLFPFFFFLVPQSQPVYLIVLIHLLRLTFHLHAKLKLIWDALLLHFQVLLSSLTIEKSAISGLFCPRCVIDLLYSSLLLLDLFTYEMLFDLSFLLGKLLPKNLFFCKGAFIRQILSLPIHSLMHHSEGEQLFTHNLQSQLAWLLIANIFQLFYFSSELGALRIHSF